MKVAHILRKYNPAEWGGTESVIHQLFGGLRQHGVESHVYCPRIPHTGVADPLAESGCNIVRFDACVPFWGLPESKRKQMIAVGGNLMSFDLIRSLWTERNLSVIHSHALGRVGGIAMTVARRKKIPFVVTIHGGVYDLPPALKASLNEQETEGWDWGKIFGLLFRARRVLDEADAIIVCNPREAELVRERHPHKRVMVQPHGVPAARYAQPHRTAAEQAFPWLKGREAYVSLGRIDPVKNQGWLVEQMSYLLSRSPEAILVLAGPCTDDQYERELKQQIARLGISERVFFTGRISPGDPRLVGLLQSAKAVVLPSVSETFGLVILEAWAAGAPILSSGTSGGRALIEHRRNGWLFDLSRPETFHHAVDEVRSSSELRNQCVEAGRLKATQHYDTTVLAGRIKDLYQSLSDQHYALRHSA